MKFNKGKRSTQTYPCSFNNSVSPFSSFGSPEDSSNGLPFFLRRNKKEDILKIENKPERRGTVMNERLTDA